MIWDFVWFGGLILQVLLGDMGAGKSSLVIRFVKGQFLDFQVIFLVFDLNPCKFELNWFQSPWYSSILEGFVQVHDDLIAMIIDHIVDWLFHRNRRLEPPSFRSRFLWTMLLWNLRSGTLLDRRGTIAWLRCITEVLLLRSSFTTSLARYPHNPQYELFMHLCYLMNYLLLS